MSKLVPHSLSYNARNKVVMWQNVMIVLSTIIVLIRMITSNECLTKYLDVFLCIITVLYFDLEIIDNFLFIEAEQKRVSDLIDNGLHSNLADDNSQNYYSNDDVKYSIYKLGVNSFENVFFTKNIVKRMLKQELFYISCVAFLYLIFILTMDKLQLIVLFQLLLPMYIVKNGIELLCFYSHIKKIFKDYKNIYTTIRCNSRDTLIIHNIISYEKIISSYKIRINSSLFRRMNNELSAKWIELKIKYKIN